jgi:hypothetical protein
MPADPYDATPGIDSNEPAQCEMPIPFTGLVSFRTSSDRRKSHYPFEA